MTLTVYQGKRSKNVILLCTVHKSVSFSDGRKKLPDSIQYYNSTKYGADILNQKARLYTTKVGILQFIEYLACILQFIRFSCNSIPRGHRK